MPALDSRGSITENKTGVQEKDVPGKGEIPKKTGIPFAERAGFAIIIGKIKAEELEGKTADKDMSYEPESLTIKSQDLK